MPQLSAIGHAAVRLVGNMVNGPKPVLAINLGGAATVKTTGAINYTIDGIAYTKAALAAVALSAMAASDLASSLSNWLQPTGLNGAFSAQPANTTSYLVLALNAAGTVKVVQGLYTGQIPLVGMNVGGQAKVPDVPDGFVPFGMIKVVTGATTFTPITDALDKASVTFTFYDLSVLPSSDAP